MIEMDTTESTSKCAKPKKSSRDGDQLMGIFMYIQS